MLERLETQCIVVSFCSGSFHLEVLQIEMHNVSEVEMHARVVVGVGKGVLFREASSFQECPHRERERFHCIYTTMHICMHTHTHRHTDTHTHTHTQPPH